MRHDYRCQRCNTPNDRPTCDLCGKSELCDSCKPKENYYTNLQRELPGKPASRKPPLVVTYTPGLAESDDIASCYQ